MNTRLIRNGFIFLLSFLTGLAFFVPVFAGSADGGGGDAIKCNDGRFYSWDYIQTRDDRNTQINPKFLAAKSAREILAVIEKNLLEKLPDLGQNLKDFNLLNTSYEALGSGITNRIWVNSKYDLKDIQDEVGWRIPRECKSFSGKLQIHQAVIKTKHGGVEKYEADSSILKVLEKNHPLQLSFLYVHEWLRSFSDDGHAIMNMNRLLHSNFTGITPYAFRDLLLSFGFDNNNRHRSLLSTPEERRDVISSLNLNFIKFYFLKSDITKLKLKCASLSRDKREEFRETSRLKSEINDFRFDMDFTFYRKFSANFINTAYKNFLISLNKDVGDVDFNSEISEAYENAKALCAQ